MEVMDRNKLIEDNIGLVYSAIKRYFPNSLNDDVIQEGMIGLCKAADVYNPEMGAFSTCAYTYILTAVRHYFRQESKQKETLSLDFEYLDNESESFNLSELVTDKSSDIDFEMIEDNEFIKTLTPRQQLIITALKDGFKQKDLAILLKCCDMTITREKNKIKRKWREYGNN